MNTFKQSLIKKKMYGIILQVTQSAATVVDTAKHAATQVQTAVTAAAATQPVENISLWSMIQKGGIIMYPLGILLVLSLYIFFERLIAIIRASKDDKNFINNIRDVLYDMKIDSAKSLCKATNSPVARMVEKGIDRMGRPIAEIERSIESVGRFEISKLEKNLKILGIVAGIAPMIGFIGTIAGVIMIFHDISLANNLEIKTIADGLYVKMITSASGLIIGVLAYSGYHYLTLLLDKVVFNIENNAIAFMDILQKEA